MKKQDHNSPSHNSHVYEEPDCHCSHEACKIRRQSVENFVQSFCCVPKEWMKILFESFGEPNWVPMYEVCFVVDNPCDVRSIVDLIGDNLEDEDLCPGWYPVGETGLLGRELDGKLILGVDGEDHNFYSYHWRPLYDALGYRRHVPSSDVSPAELAFEKDSD